MKTKEALPANVLPFRKKTRNLDSQLLKPDPFTDRVATVIKKSFDVPIISPFGIVALNLYDEENYELFVLPPDSYTPARVVLSMDQLYSLIHSLDYLIHRR